MLLVFAVLFFVILKDFQAITGLRKQINQAWSTLYLNVNEKNKVLLRLLEIGKYFLYEERELINEMIISVKTFKAPTTIGEKIQAESALDNKLNEFFTKIRNQPGLSRSQEFFEHKNKYRSLEDKISSSVKNYNEIAHFYNKKIESFPSNILAKSFRFEKFPTR
jgi:LemA protein